MTGAMQMFVSASPMAPTQRSASMPASISVGDIRSFGTQSASLTLNSSGTCTESGNQQNVSFTWLTGTGTGANYEVRATVVSGSPSGTTGSWVALSSNQTWGVTAPAGNYNEAYLTLEIRDASTLTVYATSSLFLYAGIQP